MPPSSGIVSDVASRQIFCCLGLDSISTYRPTCLALPRPRNCCLASISVSNLLSRLISRQIIIIWCRWEHNIYFRGCRGPQPTRYVKRLNRFTPTGYVYTCIYNEPCTISSTPNIRHLQLVVCNLIFYLYDRSFSVVLQWLPLSCFALSRATSALPRESCRCPCLASASNYLPRPLPLGECLVYISGYNNVQ
jgi:hypothetical protein